MAHVDDQRVVRVLDALEAQHPGAQLLVNDPWSIYYLTGFYAGTLGHSSALTWFIRDDWASKVPKRAPA